MLTESNDGSRKISSTGQNVAKTTAYSFHAFPYMKPAKLKCGGGMVSATKSLNLFDIHTNMQSEQYSRIGQL
jgi:hypothetical protein